MRGNILLTRRSFTIAYGMSIISMICIGCSSQVDEPEIAAVSGTVTLDGQPGANLLVTFEPDMAGTGGSQAGRSSTGTTDSEGKFELYYKDEAKGAVVGTHVVRISSASGGGPAGGDSAAPPIEIASQYGVESTLTKEVQSGANEFKIDVTSK